MAGLDATQFQGAELLNSLTALLAFEGSQDTFRIAGLRGYYQIVLLSTADLKGFHSRERVHERVGGPVAHQPLDLAAKVGRNFGGAAGG